MVKSTIDAPAPLNAEETAAAPGERPTLVELEAIYRMLREVRLGNEAPITTAKRVFVEISVGQALVRSLSNYPRSTDDEDLAATLERMVIDAMAGRTLSRELEKHRREGEDALLTLGRLAGHAGQWTDIRDQLVKYASLEWDEHGHKVVAHLAGIAHTRQPAGPSAKTKPPVARSPSVLGKLFSFVESASAKLLPPAEIAALFAQGLSSKAPCSTIRSILDAAPPGSTTTILFVEGKMVITVDAPPTSRANPAG